MALTGSVGAINVKVSADATGFNATMNKVGSKVAATSAKVRESSNTYAKWGIAASAAALAVGVSMVKNQMQVMDALAKTSDALGVQQKQLQALQHVAELTGTGAAQLSVNLERMQRRIGEVARKGGQAEAALTEIGIAAKEMINLPADEQLVKISQAMQGVDNASIRASIAMDLFGRDGVRMLKMMEQLGKDGLAPTVEELQKMGVALTRIDTAKVEQANDTMFRTQQVLDGVVNKISVKLSPLITKIGEGFIDAAKDANGFDKAIVNAMNNATTVVGVFADGLHGIQIIFKGLELAGKTMGFVVIKVMQGAALAIQTFVNFSIDRINGLIDNVNLLPGVSIKAIEKFELSAVASFKNLADKASGEVDRISGELHGMAMETLPSEQLRNWVEDAQASAQEVANSLIIDGGGSSLGLTGEESASLKNKIDTISDALNSESSLKSNALKSNLDKLSKSLGEESQVRNAALKRELSSLNSSLDKKLITNEEYEKKVAELKKQAAEEETSGASPYIASIKEKLDAVSKSIASEAKIRDAAFKKETSSLKSSLDEKLITQAEYEKRVAALKVKYSNEETADNSRFVELIREKLATVSKGAISESQIINAALNNDLKSLKESLDNKLITQAEYESKALALKQDAARKVLAISSLNLTNEEKSELQKKLDIVAENLKSESQLRADALKANLADLKAGLENNLMAEDEYQRKVKALKAQYADEEAADNAPFLADIQSKLDAVSKGLMSESQLRDAAVKRDIKTAKAALDNKLINEQEYLDKVKAIKQKAEADAVESKTNDQAKLQSKLDAISQSLMTETELKRLALESDLVILQEALANELITRQEHEQKVKELKSKSAADITAIEDKAKKKRDNLAELEKKTKVNAVGDTFSALSTLMNTQSKKLFEIGKAAAIGSAIVDGYKAVAKTMAETPYPFNIPLAAAQATASAVQVQGIAKQKFGGAGGGANQFSAGVPAVNTTSAGGGGGMGDRNVSISGLDPSALFSGEQVRDLLKNLAGDGADFTFLTNGG